MAINVGRTLGLATVIIFFICTGFFNVFALKCYTCIGEEACQKENLGKEGSLGAYPNGTEKEYGIFECRAAEREVAGSEMCVASLGNNGIKERGCVAWPKSANVTFEKSKVKNCHLEDGSNWAKQNVKVPCACFTDLCNGDPPTCCDDDNGEWGWKKQI